MKSVAHDAVYCLIFDKDCIGLSARKSTAYF
jgi:hypothetical protein